MICLNIELIVVLMIKNYLKNICMALLLKVMANLMFPLWDRLWMA